MIDYNLLTKAINYFNKKNFKQIEVPWAVSSEAINATFNTDDSFKSNDKYLIGSAEQGVLELIIQNKINSNQIMSVSPCFRNEIEDYLHQKQFIKLELIFLYNGVLNKDNAVYYFFKRTVIDFLTEELKIPKKFIKMQTINESNSLFSEDILINDIEYGSYGIRKFREYYYIYGTGIALPRASKILKNLYKN